MYPLWEDLLGNWMGKRLGKTVRGFINFESMNCMSPIIVAFK